jgi:hypothetical protein
LSAEILTAPESIMNEFCNAALTVVCSTFVEERPLCNCVLGRFWRQSRPERHFEVMSLVPRGTRFDRLLLALQLMTSNAIDLPASSREGPGAVSNSP